jgi:4-hydroxybenzoate polyprenyltransferase
VVAGLFAAAVVYGGAFAAEQLSTRHAVAAFMILVFLTGREVLKSVPDTDGDVIAGYRTVATRFGGAAAVGWFRVIAAAHLGIVAAWAPRSAMYVVAVAVFVLPPTAVTLWHLRGRPDAAAVQRGIDRSGLVFAGGLVALLLL